MRRRTQSGTTFLASPQRPRQHPLRTGRSRHETEQGRRGLLSPALVVCAAPCLLVVLLLGLRLSKQADPEQLLQQGQEAEARGDYDKAAQFYEQAETYSRDPAEAAYHLAGAKLHLALKKEGTSPELLEAEQGYRCCLDPTNPRRTQALYGLGNCLLHRAGTRDETSLRAALACYDLCLQAVAADSELAAGARYNREKARLLLLQLPPREANAPGDKPPSEDVKPQSPHRDNRQAMPMPDGENGSEGDANSNIKPEGTKPDEDNSATKSKEPQPGKGNLPPVPDEVETPPLSPREAGEHLQRAASKVLQERQVHHRRGEDPLIPGVKDW